MMSYLYFRVSDWRTSTCTCTCTCCLGSLLDTSLSFTFCNLFNVEGHCSSLPNSACS